MAENKINQTDPEVKQEPDVKREQPPKPKKPKRVEIFVPRGGVNDDPNVFISVNGVNYLLPRGKKSVVPEFIAKEFDRSQRALEHADAHSAELEQKASQMNTLG